MKRLVLTIDQARIIQRTGDYDAWAFMAMPKREKPDTVSDPQRVTIALQMMARGCADDQIAEQLGWKPNSPPIKQAARLHRQSIR